MLTPIPSPSRSQSSKKSIVFSEVEIKLFLERYKEGYNGGNERYKIWLKMYHPDAESILSNDSLTMHTPEQLVRTKEDTDISHVVAVSKPARKIVNPNLFHLINYQRNQRKILGVFLPVLRH